jgi:tetratricopeptide (TPR) repeat protein
MWARYIIDSGAWGEPIADWSFNTGDSFDPNLTISFIRAMRAAQNGQVAETGQYLGQFRALKTELENVISRQDEQEPSSLLYLKRLAVMEQEMLAAIEMARGEKQQAVLLAREASRLEAEIPFAFGPPFVDLPAAEYLGELLLDARKYTDAAEAFEVQLKRSRMRVNALEGKAAAQEKLGKENEAQYIRQLLETIRRTDAPDEKIIPPFLPGDEVD